MKILVVEDDELIAQTLSAILSTYHYAVEVVNDGLSALEMLEAFDFDVVLLDIFLPKLNGLEVCRQARAKGIQVPILMLTARDSSQDKAAGLDAGADDYLVKPFDPEELIARVRALLRRGRTTQDPILTLGKLILNPDSCEVTYDQRLIPLTPKEYALLELFLRNPNRVYSCGMILEHLWVHDEMPGEEAVRTHIKGLRQKLKTSGAGSDLIATVYGIGYRLKPQRDKQSATSQPKPQHSAIDSTTTVLPNKSQEITAQIEDLWRSHQRTITEQINVVESAVKTASEQTLSAQSRETAIRNAHSLAGSLGTFGVQSGSKIARSIEMILMAETHLGKSDIHQLECWVHELKQTIADQSAQLSKEPAADSFSQTKVFTLFAKDPELFQILSDLSHQLGYSLEVSASLKNAITLVENIQPEIIFFDPAIEASTNKIERFFQELQSLSKTIPVILYANSTDLEQTVTRAGNIQYLPMPLSKVAMLQAIYQAIDHTQGAEASILAIDDDPSILALLRAILAPWGMIVHTLSDPSQFVATLELAKPDLIILDVEMPTHNGIELCKLLRQDSHWSEIPVLFLTVHGNSGIINDIFKAGADDYIQKPIVGPELVTRILNRLERNRLPRHLKPDLRQSSPPKISAPKQGLAVFHDKLVPRAIINILNIADDAIICVDHEQNIIFFNLGAEQTFGYCASEILGHSLNELVPQRYSTAHRQHVKNFGASSRAAKQMGERQEIYGLRKDGTEFPAEASIAKQGKGNDAMYTVIMRDITQRKQEEQKKSDFISVVSHELRTPLTSILGSLEMLSRGLQQKNPEEMDNLISIAVSSTERLVHLVNSIIDIERIEVGKLELNLEIYDLAIIANDVVNAMKDLASSQAVVLEQEIESVHARVDRDRIFQMLTNLLSYAIHASSPQQTVSLILTRQLNQAQLEIIDQGKGIPADQIEHIFEKFQTMDLENPSSDRITGLSLAVCRSIVEQHHGSIRVESEESAGSHFFITIPRQDIN